MEYETLRSPSNFKGGSSVRKIAPFKGNFEDTDQPDEEEDNEEDEEEEDEDEEDEDEEDDE